MTAGGSTLDELRIDRGSTGEGRSGPWRWLLVLFLLAGIVGAGVWWRIGRAVPVRTVSAEEAAGTGRRVLLNASGYVTARREATVSSKITGRVMEVILEEGRRVEAGQVLARLDDTNVKADLRLAEAQLAAVKAELNETAVRLTLAEQELKRIRTLTETGFDTQSALDRATAEVKSLEARREKQEADAGVAAQQVAVWQQHLEDTIIRAPFSGIVTMKNAQPGEMISPISAGGGFTRTGIGTIVDMQSLEIEVDVNESYLHRVTADQPVEATLDAYPDWRIPGRVIAIIPTADRQKATVKVRVKFDQLDPRILPQMAVKVAFLDPTPEGAQRVVVLPKGAILQLEGRDSAYVVRSNRVEARTLRLGPGGGDTVQVLAGVVAGEKVVIETARPLRPGARVQEPPVAGVAGPPP